MTTVCVVWDGRLWGSNLEGGILDPALRFSFNNPWLLGQALFTHLGYQSSNSFLKITFFLLAYKEGFHIFFVSIKPTFAPATPSPLNPLIPSIHPFTSILHVPFVPLPFTALNSWYSCPSPSV